MKNNSSLVLNKNHNIENVIYKIIHNSSTIKKLYLRLINNNTHSRLQIRGLFQAISNLPYLEILDLFGNSIGFLLEQEFVLFCNAIQNLCYTLKTLNLANNNLNECFSDNPLNFDIFCNTILTSCLYLEKLDLSGNMLAKLNHDQWELLGKTINNLFNLKVLDLSFNGLTQEQITIFHNELTLNTVYVEVIPNPTIIKQKLRLTC